jgi:site-specific DNA-methyltransferase (adenine-specific)
LALLPKLDRGSVDLILCDLPYGTTANAWDSVIPLDKLWPAFWHVAKDNAAIVLTAQCPFDKVLGVSCIDALRYEWIWNKERGTGHLNANKMPMKAHENVLVFYRKLPTYNPQKTPGDFYKVQSAHGSSNYGAQQKTESAMAGRYPLSIQTFSIDKHNQVHPTQKPVALMAYLVKTYSNPGDVVLDCCMGSGTTGVAAIANGRDFIGMERDPDYFAIAKKRINQARGPFADAPKTERVRRVQR